MRIALFSKLQVAGDESVFNAKIDVFGSNFGAISIANKKTLVTGRFLFARYLIAADRGLMRMHYLPVAAHLGEN
jgi:hypothetical protein